MRFAFSKVLLLVTIFVWMGFAVNRPSVPGTITATFYPGPNSIKVEGLYTDAADSLHVVLLSDLSASIGYAYEIGKSQGSDGPVINYATKNFPITVDLGSQVRERYFAAVAASSHNEKNERIFSGWKLYSDANGVPIAISTSRDSLGENLIYRARKINENNGNEVVIDLSFSLPILKAADCKFYLYHNNTQIIQIDSLSSISGSKHDIRDAINTSTGNDPLLVLKRDTLGFCLYNFYRTINYSDGDSISAVIVKRKEGIIYDTLRSRISVFEDTGQKNIISTIYSLCRMSASTADPLYPDSLDPITDSTRIRLLTTAMLDLSLANNSPKPEVNEESQGIFTNYMQFMDNVVRNWSTVCGNSGLARLQNILSQILTQNKGEIIDPVSVDNKGTCFENVQNPKRQNYAFYEGYSRVNWNIERPNYGAMKSGIGVMSRISNNLDLYGAKIKSGGLIEFDELPFLNGAIARRIIYKAHDTLVYNLLKDDGGLWVKGRPEVESKKFYVGISPVRLPISKLNRGIIKIDTAFSLPVEEKGTGDPDGNIVGGGEKSLLKVKILLDRNGKTDTIVSKYDLELLHGNRRFVQFDTSYSKNIEYSIAGPDSIRNKIVLQTLPDGGVIIEDHSTGSNYILEAIKKIGSFITQVINWKFSASKLGFRDINNGNMHVVAVGSEPYPLYIDQNPDKLLAPEKRIKGKIYLKTTGGVSIHSSTSISKSDLLFPPNDEESFEKEFTWQEYSDLILNKTIIYLVDEKGAKGTFSIIFKYNDQIEESLEEMIDYVAIKVKKITPLDENGYEIQVNDLVNSTNGLDYNINFYSGPTLDEIKENLDLSISVYGGNNGSYPTAIISPVEIYSDGSPKNGANINVFSSAGENYAYIRDFPITTHLPTANTDLLHEPIFTYDYFKDKGQSDSDCEMLGTQKPGMQFGKSRYGSKKNNEFDLEQCISPVTDRTGILNYIQYAGVVYPTFMLKNEIVNVSYKEKIVPFRNTCSWQAGWFVQSGHGISDRLSGLAIPSPSKIFYLLDDEYSPGTLHANKLKQEWQNVNVLILNSCYNLNLNLITGAYPSVDKIWNEDLSKESMHYIDGRWNNGLKWLEIIEKRGAVLGWGQCNIDGTKFGAQSTGQSPKDVQGGVEWTAGMMSVFVNELKKLSVFTSSNLAEQWVRAAEAQINATKPKDVNPNMYNAVGIGLEGDVIHVWALDKSSVPMAKDVWYFTIP